MWQNIRHGFLSLHKSRLLSTANGFGRIRNREKTLKMVESLKMYKEKFNTTIIPYRFQVPTDDDEWPKEMWGDNAGRRINQCRKLYFENLLSSHDIQLLEQSGMQWEVQPLTVTEVNNIAEALYQYKANYGDTNVPLDFKIPKKREGNWLKCQRGIALGKGVQRIRNIYFHNRLDKKYFDILDSAGLIWNAINSNSVLNLLEALKIYKKLYGTTLIPLTFAIPETELHQWPQKFHNKYIGKRLSRVRTAYHQKHFNDSEIKALEDAGIQWVTPKVQHKYTWVSRLVQGLEIYNKFHGTTLVRTDFVVPSDTEDWPVDLHGHRLGAAINRARTYYRERALSEQYISRLEEAGIEWVDPSRKYIYTWVSRLAKGLEVYKKLYGTTLVHHKFVVPSNAEEWSVELHGYKLGGALNRARNRYTGKVLGEDDVSVLEEAGIQWVAPFMQHKYTWVSRLVIGLEIYKKLHGTTLVPQKFVVPSNAEEWPVELHGLKLGVALNGARTRKACLKPSEIEDLNSVGIVWAVNKQQWVLKLEKALQVYNKLHGTTRIPPKFIAPTSTDNNSDQWPKELQGERLGYALSYARARKSKLATENVKILEEAGIEW